MVGAVYLDDVAVVGEDFQYSASFIPSPRSLASLVLYGHVVTEEDRGKLFGTLLELLVL